MKIRASEKHWGLPSPPIVGKNMWFSYVNWESGREDEDDDEDDDDDVDDVDDGIDEGRGGEGGGGVRI